MPTGNAPGHLGTRNPLKQHETSAEVQVAETIGDTAYSDGNTRQVLADAVRELTARMPERPQRLGTPRSRNADPGLHPPVGMLQHVTVQEPVARVVRYKGDFG